MIPDEHNELVSQSEASERAEQPDAAIRIVIADDHPIFRDGLRKVLALEEDFKVVGEAEDGAATLQILQDQDPDLLLLDLKMPGQDGLAILQILQTRKVRTKVIVLTASDDESEYVQAMKYGTAGIVLKQSATELLIKSIRKVHGGEIWLDTRTTAAVMKQFASVETAGDRNRSPLSQRELEIVALVAQGLRNREIAERMFISEQTVKNHLHNIFDKLGVSDRLELALYAIHKNIKPAEPVPDDPQALRNGRIRIARFEACGR